MELPNANLAATRAAAETSIDAAGAGDLRTRWRFAFRAPATFSGIYASTPVGDRTTAYVQDLRSNVYALDRSTERAVAAPVQRAQRGAKRARGRRRARLRRDGLGRIRARGRRGRELWRRHLTSVTEQFVNIAPVPWQDLVFLSTVGYAPGGRGAIYALDAETGLVRWKFDTIERPWATPRRRAAAAPGSGLGQRPWAAYAGNSNPTPWGGSPERPNGAAFPGPAR